ncbi:MAG: hypothetical protein HY303_09225 [Candidatus Wallbacteria bacterium]|nr:hypothetical protein [Candidatus Wallbacteria bacterium]
MIRSKRLFLSCLAAVLATGLVVGQEPEGPAAPGDSDEALVSQVLSLYHRDEAAKAPRGCPTTLMRRLTSRWQRLDDETRERLKPYVLMPGQDEPGSAPSAPGQDEWKFARTKNFLVFWKSDGPDAVKPGDGNRNNIPDYVERVGNFLEKAYETEVAQWGFVKPPTCPQYRVYLKGLNHNGLTHPAGGSQSWIEINADIDGYTKRTLGAKYGPQVSSDPQGIEAGLLKAVCAHEFFHAVQANYSWDQAAWWAEGGAEWVGEMVFPESDFYLNNLPLHFQQPQVSLFSEELWFEYSASIFTGFLVENLGGAPILRRLWEACRSSRIEAALQSSVGDMKQLFTAFWCYNYLRAYKDGAKYPTPETVLVKQYPFSVESAQIAEPQYFGANLFRFDSLASGKPLQITVTPKSGSQLGAKLIVIDAANKKWKIVPIQAAAGGALQATASGASAVLVIGNFTPKKSGSYSLRAAY